MVDLIDTAALEREIDQIWAEALTIYEAGESLDLDASAKREAKSQQDLRVVTDDLTGVITEWPKQPVPVDYLNQEVGAEDFDEATDTAPRDRVCAVQVWVELLGGRLERLTRRESIRINGALRQIPALRKR